MTRRSFSEGSLPSFEEAPSVVLIAGNVEFFVEEAAGKAAEKLAGEGSEVLRFDDEAPAETISDALLNRSLFSAHRIVQFDVTRLLGSETPGQLLLEAVEAWEKGTPAGKREAYRRARALLGSLQLSGGGAPEETAEIAARRVRKKDLIEPLTEILRAMPEERGGSAVLVQSLQVLLERGNDGTIALLTATAPPEVGLLVQIVNKGLLLEVSIAEKEEAGAMARLARARAKEREVTLDSDAIERLRVSTDGRPELFAAELEKLLAWAGPGGHVRAADVRENVEDESSEDIYAFYEAIGRRDAADALGRLERLFSPGRSVRAGERPIDTEDYWPTRFCAMLAEEIRRMLLVRSRLEEAGRGLDASTSYPIFQARVAPLLSEPVVPFGVSPFSGSAYAWFKAAQRAARYTTRELASALGRAADVDVKLRNSAPPLETLSAYVGGIIAGHPSP